MIFEDLNTAIETIYDISWDLILGEVPASTNLTYVDDTVVDHLDGLLMPIETRLAWGCDHPDNDVSRPAVTTTMIKIVRND